MNEIDWNDLLKVRTSNTTYDYEKAKTYVDTHAQWLADEDNQRRLDELAKERGLEYQRLLWDAS